MRVIVYVLVPAFGTWQHVRLRRALHVFQLEGYNANRFLLWCRAHPRRARFMRPTTAKKPLVMTGRAWRVLVVATLLSVAGVLLPAVAAHVWAGGAPADLIAWTVTAIAVFFAAPRVLVAADYVLSPVQAAINARYLRRAQTRLKQVDPIVVGVTGSFGKTSTKFAIAGLLGPRGSVLATPGSFNTPMGVCRAINEGLEPSHRFIVVEMGAYGEGEVAELCRLVGPKIGVLTAIGPMHLERFGSLEAIARAKYEIVSSLPPEGVAVMNVDDPRVCALADATRSVRVVRYGLLPAGHPDVTARDVRVALDGTHLTIVDVPSGRCIETTTKLLGRHAIGHVLAAVAVATAADRDLLDLNGPISALEAVEHRLQLIHGGGGITVIDDAFNSNPEGAAAALEVLDAMPGGRKVVVTPGIVELGELQAGANRELGRYAAAVADLLIVVAPLNRDALVAGAHEVPDGATVIAVDSLAEATKRLESSLSPGDVVLFENDLPDQYER